MWARKVPIEGSARSHPHIFRTAPMRSSLPTSPSTMPDAQPCTAISSLGVARPSAPPFPPPPQVTRYSLDPTSSSQAPTPCGLPHRRLCAPGPGDRGNLPSIVLMGASGTQGWVWVVGGGGGNQRLHVTPKLPRRMFVKARPLSLSSSQRGLGGIHHHQHISIPSHAGPLRPQHLAPAGGRANLRGRARRGEPPVGLV